jgi:phospholipase/lecithinase/hemolysin
MSVRHRSICMLALFVVCLLPATAFAGMPAFDSLYVFGDSLADNGNVFIQSRMLGAQPPVPPSTTPHKTYFDKRFTNGPVEFEYLWHQLSGHAPGSSKGLKPFLASPFAGGAVATNFAYGGTGTPYLDQTPGGMWAPGLKGQVELFRIALLGKKPSKHALYAIATGANDYRDDAFNEPMNPNEVVQNIVDAIVSLHRLGARHVMVFDLPDLGKIPANMQTPEMSEAASAISDAHNALLGPALTALQAKYPNLHLIQVTLDPLFNTLVTGGMVPAPALLFEESPLAAQCLFFDPAACYDVKPELFNSDLGFIFWDVVHPTTEAHRYLAQYLYQLLIGSY